MFKNRAEPVVAALEWTIRRAGRKGRGVWADYGTNLVWHIEGEKSARSSVVKLQIRAGSAGQVKAMFSQESIGTEQLRVVRV